MTRPTRTITLDLFTNREPRKKPRISKQPERALSENEAVNDYKPTLKKRRKNRDVARSLASMDTFDSIPALRVRYKKRWRRERDTEDVSINRERFVLFDSESQMNAYIHKRSAAFYEN